MMDNKTRQILNDTDSEIIKASNAIDKALLSFNKSNRGEVAIRILSIVRNLNDNIALKLWLDLHPNEMKSVKNVAKEFASEKNYKFISIFHKYLSKSVSHFTPTEDGADRLILKYYQYILELKKLMKVRFGMEIVQNIDLFLPDLDVQTKEYYEKVAEKINMVTISTQNFDNYYIRAVKPFFINQNTYFEVTLEPGTDKQNKFNRITAFTKYDIFKNYCVALEFFDTTISMFGVEFPIRLITDWHVSIRPCEINNYAKILKISTNIQRGSKDYKLLMNYIKDKRATLVDVIDLPYKEFNNFMSDLDNTTKSKQSSIAILLRKSRNISNNNLNWKNIIRYILISMNNSFIHDQLPTSKENEFSDLFLSAKCYPFEKKPYSFNPKRHISNLSDLYHCINVKNYHEDLLARLVHIKSFTENKIFIPIGDFSFFGNTNEIKGLIKIYNDSLYSGFRPASEIGIYKKYLYKVGELNAIKEIIAKLTILSESTTLLNELFSSDKINSLKTSTEIVELDDIKKEEILKNMFLSTKVRLIYGAAGTGKTTLINYVSFLMKDKQKLFIAKTNPAVNNLRRKINDDGNSDYMTIDKFINQPSYSLPEYDLIVVDECSTVKNEDMIKILDKTNNAILILVGDIYQIESIGLGNWFNLCKYVFDDNVISELTEPFRSENKNLIDLWKETREIKNNNLILEQIVKNDYSHKIDEEIFISKSDDEIILCLNYNGLYGLNNINKLLQLDNPNNAVKIGIYEFKINDPILFNDSGRFELLYNNLKGRIEDINDLEDRVYFAISVDIVLSESLIDIADGLYLIKKDKKSTVIGFYVSRSKPFDSDNENTDDESILPFQIAYAVSIHKSQGLEYESVKIVIADDSEEKITHNIFYTAITRAKKYLNIYWSSEVCNRVLSRMEPVSASRDYYLFMAMNNK